MRENSSHQQGWPPRESCSWLVHVLLCSAVNQPLAAAAVPGHDWSSHGGQAASELHSLARIKRAFSFLRPNVKVVSFIAQSTERRPQCACDSFLISKVRQWLRTADSERRWELGASLPLESLKMSLWFSQVNSCANYLTEV